MGNAQKLLLLTLAATIVSGCAARAGQTPSQGLGIAVEHPQVPRALALYEGPGSVTPAHTYQLGFEIQGRIARVNYDVGDHVTAGAVLASLDASDYAAQAAAASAQAASAPSSAQAQLERARAAAALAHANLLRYQALFDQGAVSAQVRDNAVAADRDAQAQVDAARAQLTQSGAAIANARYARITLGKTELVSPADAIVQKRAVEPGDTASPGVTAFTLISSETPDVLVSVPERVRARIPVGTAAIVIAGTRRYYGSVTRAEPAADEVSRTAQVRVRVRDFALPVGSVVDVQLGVWRASGQSVPLGAVMTDSSGNTSVELYDSSANTVSVKAVHVVGDAGDRVTVDGLASSDLVVTQGQYEAKPGDRVHLVTSR